MSALTQDELVEALERATKRIVALAAENERYRETLDWIRHQTGVSTCDDAVRAMNDAYEAAHRGLDEVPA